MATVNLTIDGQPVAVPAGTTILEAARKADIYIPSLCYHPDLPPAKGRPAVRAVFHGKHKIENAMPEQPDKGCGICVVEVEGQSDLVVSCAAEAADGMVVETQNERIKDKRQENLVPIMARHRHACLTCAQQEGCPRTQCSSNVPENERLPIMSAFRMPPPNGCPLISRYLTIIPCLKEIIIFALAARGA